MKKITSVLVVLCLITTASIKSYAQISIGISVRIAPPALPVYTQPPCPAEGYMWTPGYWAYDEDGGYYWVPGVWVAAPRVGYLWTPGYWGYDGSIYAFHSGYWGQHIGFYGGVNYGCGYGGSGYGGGRWSGNTFQYNTAVVNVNNTVVHNTYVNNTVINNNTTINNNHTSFNGPGGVAAQPKPQELAAAREEHVQPTAEQVSHREVASKDRSQFANVNNGHPATTAMNKVNGNRFSSEGHTAHADRSSNPGNNAGQKHDDNANTPQKRENNQAATDNRAENQPKEQANHQNQNVAANNHPAANRVIQHPARQQNMAQHQQRQQPHANNAHHNPKPAEEHEKHR
jgi:hypothetical protein